MTAPGWIPEWIREWAPEPVPEPAPEWTLGEFLAHCLALELEAVERYADLADQMELAGNAEVAGLFRRLSEVEELHLEKMRRLAHGVEVPALAPSAYRWAGGSPEAVPFEGAHYLMTPYHALDLARSGELGARQFFAEVADAADDPEIQRLAAELRDEEAEHAALIEAWLARYPPPENGWDDDLDPPPALA